METDTEHSPPLMGGTIYGMKKTTVYLEPDLDRALNRLAASTGLSKSEVIRMALRKAVEEAPRPVVTAIGVGEGPGDVAGDVDRHLTETKFGES